MYPLGLISLWNAKTPTISKVGPQIVTSVAGNQPDADGNMVPWPVNHPGKGVMVQPAYTNIWPTSGLLAASTEMTGVTAVTTGDYTRVAATASNTYAFIRMSGGVVTTTSRSARYTIKYGNVPYVAIRTLNLDGTTVKWISVNLTTAAINNPSDSTTVTAELSAIGVVINLSVPVVGSGKVYILTELCPCRTATPTADTRANLGTIVGGDYIDVYSKLIVTDSPFQLPYVPPGTSVTSTAATSSNNGLAIPLDAAMTAALSGGAFTAAALVHPLNDNPTAVYSTLLGARNSINSDVLLTYSATLIARSNDGTSSATIAGAVLANTKYLLISQTNVAKTQFRVGYRRYTSAMTPIDANIVWGALVAYDGSMNPLTHLRFGYGLTVPIGFLQTQLWAKSASDAEILKVVGYAL